MTHSTTLSMSQQAFIHAFEQAIPNIASQVADMIITKPVQSYVLFSREQLATSAATALRIFVQSLRINDPQPSVDHWTRMAKIRAEQGVTIDDILSVIFGAGDVYNRFALPYLSDDPNVANWWLQRLHHILSAETQALSGVFVATREQIIHEQHAQIRELSTPIIPLYTGVLAMPLVGNLDTARIGQVMEALLFGIAQYQAEVVIIDITGVSVVDTSVANYLLQAARAAKLLGATVVLVGISSQISQTVVQLGLDLSNIVIRANLQSGIEFALAQQGRAIRAA